MVFVFVASLTSIANTQEIDDRKDRRAPPAAALHWQNLGNALQHISGASARYSREHRLNVVTLQPGEYVDFQVPSHELIRIQTCCAEQLHGGETEVWTSNGTGLFRKLKTATATDESALIAAPDHSGISIGRVVRSTPAKSPITVAIFTSTRQPNRLLDYYQCPVICDQKQVEVSDDRGRKPRLYTAVKSGRRYPLEIEGSTRVRLESRLKYDSDASQHQFYWIKIFLDGVEHKTLLFDTLPQRMHRQFVDGAERLIGEREFAYLDFDSENQSVEIEVSHSVFLRADAIGLKLVNPIINHQLDPPSWEKVWLDEDAWLEEDFVGDGKSLDDYLQNGVGPQQAQVDPQWDPWINYPRLMEVARDNKIRHGGLRAYMWMRAIAARRLGESNFGDELTVAELVTKIRNRFTYFRDLMPVDLFGSDNPRTVAFPVRSIRRPNQTQTETIVGQQHIEEAARRLATTTMYQLATGGGPTTNALACDCEELIYRPAEDLGASILRIVVDRQQLTANLKIAVQYDDRPPFELQLIPESALRKSAFVPGRAEAAIASLSESHRRYDSGPWGGPFAALDSPVAMIKAGVAEFLLPSSVQQIKISASSLADPSVYIGVQCLMSGHTELSELARQKHQRQTTHASSGEYFSNRQLENDAVDLERLRDSHLQQINKSITPGLDNAPPQSVWYKKQLEAYRGKALRLAEAGNWLGVLETLSEIIHHTDGPDRNATIISRAQVLDHAGEHFLAEHQRRGWMKFAQDVGLKKQLLKSLLDDSLNGPGNDPESETTREMLLAFATAEIGDDQTNIDFSKQLADNGRFRFALLALPASARGADIDELILRCSFQLRWWKTFKTTLKQVSSIERRNYWGAMKAVHLGQFKRAWRLLDAAGADGQTWLKHWKYGDYIFTRLSSREFLTRMSAIEDWESWLAKHPGGRQWNPEAGLVTSSQGAATLYSPNRDLRMDFARCDTNQSSTIRIHGPAHIRVELRPLHRLDDSLEQSSMPPLANADGTISGLIEISNNNQLERIPVLNNTVSDTLEVDGLRHRYRPGVRIIAELKIPAGLNELRLTSRDFSTLFRVLVERPEILAPVLPPITETTLSAVVLGKFGPRCNELGGADDGGAPAIGTDSVRLVSREQRGQSIDHPFRRFDGAEFDLETLQPHLNQQLGDMPTWQNRINPTADAFVLLGQDAVFKQALAIAYDQSPTLDSTTETRLRQIASLQSLKQSHPDNRQLSKLYKWMKMGFAWSRFEQFDSRAGVYFEKVDTWRPLSPTLRVRKSLLGDIEASRAIVGDASVEIDLSGVFAPEIEVTLTRPRVGMLPTLKTEVAWEVAGRQQSVILNSHDHVEKFRLPLTPDVQRIRFWQTQPWANHFALVSIAEVLADGTIAPALAKPTKQAFVPEPRSWHVSTKDEPLTFRVVGPNVIRIDRLIDDQVMTQIIPVVASDRTFELLPEGDQRVGRYRIYQLDVAEFVAPIYRPTAKQNKATTLAKVPGDAHGDIHGDGRGEDSDRNERWLHESVDQVFASVEDQSFNGPGTALNLLGLNSPDSEPGPVVVDDVSVPGVHDTGTTGFHIGYQQRRAFDEFPVIGVPERFFQVGLSNRKFDRWKNEYRQTDYFIRPRIGSGPTFGLVHQGDRIVNTVNRNDDDSADGHGDWHLNWRTFAFGQYAGTPIRQPASSFPWTAGFSADIGRVHQINSRLRHHPTVQVFGRYLSETRDGFADTELDIDVFTRFKANHRFGLRLSDQFVFQRYLDRRLYLRPMLSTNEDQLIPDSIGFAVGSDHMLGPAQMHLGYRMLGFLTDNDREETAIQHVFRMDVKAEQWSPEGFRSEVDFSIVQELYGGTSIGISFSRYFSDGRHYRDFRPGTILFKALRQERAVKTEAGALR